MECGLDPSQFWRLTPREIGVIFDGAVSKLKRERDDRSVLAWNIAALSRQKKLPKLESLLGEQKASGRQMTPEQIEAVMKGFFAKRRG